MTSKLQELQDKVKELEEKLQLYVVNYERAETKAETWEKAFNLMTHHGVPVNDEVLKKVRSRKTIAENIEEGQRQAQLFLKTNNIQELEQQSSGESFGVQNAWLTQLGAWLMEQIVERIVGFLIQLLKENAVNVVDKLLGYSEDKIVEGYMRLGEGDKELLKKQLKEHSRFESLLRKIEEREQKQN